LIPRGKTCRLCALERGRGRDRTRRDPAQKVRNTYRYRRFRAAVIAAHPWCERCGTTADLTIDHIEPMERNLARALDPTNVRVWCRRCNSRKGARGGTAQGAQSTASGRAISRLVDRPKRWTGTVET